ncbi:phosphoenolpyruvate mutase, partial [Candidatus Marinamargulisbacteria bacterium SCGC AG-439-L15]
MTKCKKLSEMLCSKDLSFMMEAHNGLSAKIVEETGFEGIWASGLSLSASLGVRDNNEMSWTQVVDVLEYMSDATTVPILLDGDTGYGNFNNMRRLVKKLEQIEVAGVCIEDKLFPKQNSFIDGDAQPLADIDEFSGKIKAAKDTQKDNDFCVVARTEAFIAGWGLDEALKRAEAYRQAGADAILVHSKQSTSAEIRSFMKEWADRHPVVIVPTKYFTTPTDEFRQLGIRLVIWANHNLRMAIKSMRAISEKIYNDQSLMMVEHEVAPLSDVFGLQGADELKQAEKKYLPVSSDIINAIVLAAGKGASEIGNSPNALLNIGEKSILEHQLDSFKHYGIKDVTVVRGYEKSQFPEELATYIDNDLFDSTQEVYSLSLAKDKICGTTVVTFGDVVFKPYMIQDLLNNMSDIAILVDATAEVNPNDTQDFVRASDPFQQTLFDQNVCLEDIGVALKESIQGEFIGVWKMSQKGAEIVNECLKKLSASDQIKTFSLNDLFKMLLKSTPISISYIQG